MASQYNNFKTYLERNESGEVLYEMITTESEFIERKKESKTGAKFSFICKNSHINELTCASFINKKSKIEYSQLCSTCFNKKSGADVKAGKLEELKAEILALNGHVVLSYENNKEVEYQCGNCGEIRKTEVKNLKRSVGYCNLCQNNENKIPFKELKNRVEAMGFQLLLKPEEYKNNKQKLPLICICGNDTYSAVLSDIEGGKKCSANCKTKKYKETCDVKYGVKNYFAAEEFQEKRKETCLQKYGTEHHMQNEEIKKKAEETCLKFYGEKWVFVQDHVFEKIRATHKAKYGVEYPLQSATIQEKINAKFIELWGAKRPFLSEQFIIHFKALMKEKYGEEWYVKSDHCKALMREKYGSDFFINSDYLKQEMKEKYGSEYYVNSDHYKKFMLETYGAEHPMHCPELFHKATKTMFSSKPYTFPSGREVQIMGFENLTLNCLQTKINSVLKRTIKEEEILVGNDVPCFEYQDDTGKKHIYYPDICVKDTNLIIEVKSVYTFNFQPEINYQKFKAVARSGKIMQVYIYNGRKKLIDIWIFDGKKELSKAGRTCFDKCIKIQKDSEIIDEDIQNEFYYEQFISDLFNEIKL
jgi:hypothetical protein